MHELDEWMSAVEALLDRQDKIIERLDKLLERAGGESRSSVTIGSTSAGLIVKSYADGMTERAGTEATQEFLRTRSALNNEGVAAIEKTVRALGR